ncbi:hypothetical protein OG866_15375 [Streptomyces sp. NBC_00663]|uniref:hypothetical protein n=1 Tax=Streptomyces sp. NBC_00663 TaxID=2975801 RepID=UPI002E30C91B|nr:hypothetical protein [Streptomyces sp. NBC_00663]
MHETLVIAAVLVLTAGLGIGLAAVTTGWLIPGRGRAKVVRPRVWGYGTLIGQAGIGTFLFVGPLSGPSMEHVPYAMAGMVVFALGLYVQRLATKTSF